MKLRNAANEFTVYRRGAGYAANTVRLDRSALNKLFDVVGDIELRSITPMHLDTLFASHSHLSAGTLNTTHSNLGAFFKWASTRGHIRSEANPLLTRRYLKDPPRDRQRVAVSDFPRLLDVSGHPQTRAVLAIAINLMLRGGEISSLKIGDLNLESGEIRITVHKSGGLIDMMPISSDLDREMRRWLTWYSAEVGELLPNYYLVPAKRTSPMRLPNGQISHQKFTVDPNAPMSKIADVAKVALKNLGWEEMHCEGIHTIRRSAARGAFDELVGRGYDGALRIVQSMLHHKNSSMTERYLGLSVDRKQRDDIVRGQSLYPSLHAANVVRMDRVANG